MHDSRARQQFPNHEAFFGITKPSEPLVIGVNGYMGVRQAGKFSSNGQDRNCMHTFF